MLIIGFWLVGAVILIYLGYQEQAVKEHKKKLIKIISEYLAEKRAYRENELRLIRQIVQGTRYRPYAIFL